MHKKIKLYIQLHFIKAWTRIKNFSNINLQNISNHKMAICHKRDLKQICILLTNFTLSIIANMLTKSTIFLFMILIYTERKFGRWQHFFRTLFDRKLESNLFYKLNITLMGLCLPSLDINVVFTRQLCGKSIHPKSLMHFF